MKYSFILLAVLGASLHVHSQQRTYLNIGDRVPDITFSMVNYSSPTAKVSDFRDKLLIMDFWATWCTSCLHSVPKMDSLQRKHRDILQVLLVGTKSTRDDASSIHQWFKRVLPPNGGQYNLPSSIKDTIADKLFRHKTLPHCVWILNGQVKAFTSTDQVTSSNIEAVYKGQPVSLRMKVDDYDYNNKMPLFVDGNGGSGSNILYRSILTGFADGLPVASSMSDTKDKLITRYSFTNHSILKLYQKAYQKGTLKSRVLLEVKDKSKLVNDGDWDSWKYDNAYCYELITPPIPLSKVLQKMRDDLFGHFGYTASVEQRKVRCYVLKATAQVTAAADTGRKPYNNFGRKETLSYMHNQPVYMLTGYLDEMLGIPVLDETNYKCPVDMDFGFDMCDLSKLQAVLKGYGFVLEETKRELEMFVMKDKINM